MDKIEALGALIHQQELARRRANPWQPIETAPKDETQILMYRAGDKLLVSCSGFFAAHNGATHWMPLPEPPTQ